METDFYDVIDVKFGVNSQVYNSDKGSYLGWSSAVRCDLITALWLLTLSSLSSLVRWTILNFVPSSYYLSPNLHLHLQEFCKFYTSFRASSNTDLWKTFIAQFFYAKLLENSGGDFLFIFRALSVNLRLYKHYSAVKWFYGVLEGTR